MKKNYYEILGLPRTATAEQIKRRYRILARKYHPDVIEDKSQAHIFVEINEAYQTLIDPNSRAAYNLTLPPLHENKSSSTATGSTTSSGSSSRPQNGSQRRTAASSPVDPILRDAQFSFVKGRFNEATNLCRKVLGMDRTNARAHAILGDIYRAQGKTEKAIDEYIFAVEYDPDDVESRIKLEKLAKQSRQRVMREQENDRAAEAKEREARVTRPRPPRQPRRTSTPQLVSKRTVAVAMGGWMSALVMLLSLIILPGEPISSLKIYLPLVDKWSWNLVCVLLFSPAVTTMMMMLTGLLDHPDDELVFDGGGGFPVGLPLVLFSGLFFWGAAVFYLLLGAIQEGLSRSILKVFACVTVIVLFAGFLYPMGGDQVWLLGGNAAFMGALAGWYAGAMIRPLSG